MKNMKVKFMRILTSSQDISSNDYLAYLMTLMTNHMVALFVS